MRKQNQNINCTRYFQSLLYILLLLIAFLLFQSPSYARTTVSGEVYGTWTADEGPYIVEDDLVIPQDSTLILEPGVEVIFDYPSQEFQNTDLFEVYGSLIAIGTVSDSIFFSSTDPGFEGFLCNEDIPARLIHLEYCVIDYAKTPIYAGHGTTILRNSRIRWGQDPGRLFYEDITIENCSFPARLVDENESRSSYYRSLNLDGNNNPVTFNNVYAPNVMVAINSAGDQVFNCNVNRFYFFQNIGDTEIFSNQMQSCYINPFASGNFHIHDNLIHGHPNDGLTIHHSNVVIEDNYLQNIKLLESHSIVNRNTIIDSLGYGAIEVTSGSIWMRNNIIFSRTEGTNLHLQPNDTASAINNTIISDDKGIKIWDGDGYVEIINNIILGDGYESTGIYQTFSNNNPPEIVQYNCFGLLSQNTYSFEFPDGNIIADPLLSAGDPFDYHLQASSPCIDAGDPDFPNDPDGTQCDIGAIFYDQRLDNPPTITSPTFVEEQAGSYFSYTATATDDFGPINFTFQNLPEGIEVSDRGGDWVVGDKQIAGTVPFDIPGFTFTVIASDVIGQVDTQYVYVDLEAMNILGGEISGILPSSGSPYLVVENLVIPEGDSLVVEPGTQLIFRYDPVSDRRLKIEAYGKLISQGTENDSITYTIEPGYSHSESWNGIRYFNTIDTLHFTFTKISFSKTGIQLADHSSLNAYNCLFEVNRYGILGNGNNDIILNNCRFDAIDSTMRNEPIFVDSLCVVSIDSSTFQQRNCEGIIIETLNSELNINNCNFYDGYEIKLSSGSIGIIMNCLFENILVGIDLSNFSNGLVTNNLFLNHNQPYSRGIMVCDTTSQIFNNIFKNQRTGIEFRYYTSETNLPDIYNNIFLGNNRIAYVHGNNLNIENFQYNCFYENDTLAWNCTIDENNLQIDPLFADSLTYYLYENSPCINTGNPDFDFNDLDGTRNDMGLYGGPYGRLYEYPISVFENNSQKIINFEIIGLYPNPFNSSQKLSFTISRNQNISISLYNCLGRLVNNYKNEFLNSGQHEILIDGRNLATGTYFVKISTKDQNRIIKTILIK